MKADGTDAHPIAPEMTAEGSFSGDGKRIVYVASMADHASELVTADADGSHPTPLKLPPSVYAAPRWLPNSKSIIVASRDAFGDPGSTPKPTMNSEKSLRGEPGAKPASRHLAKPSVSNPQPGPFTPGPDGTFKAVWVVGADGSSLRRVSPPSDDSPPRGSGLDEDAEAFVNHLSTPSLPDPPVAAAPGDTGDAEPPPQPIPPGHTVKYKGVSVFLRDAAGNLTPMPDGIYRTPDGAILRVHDGKSTTF